MEGFRMPVPDRIRRNPEVVRGQLCLRGMRVTVAMTVGLVALIAGSAILKSWPTGA